MTQWLSGLYYADFISFYSPTQLCGGVTTKSNSNELPISVPLSFFHFVCYALCILLELRQDEGGSIPSTWGVSESCRQGTIVLAITRIEHALNAGWKTLTILALTSRHSSWLDSSLAHQLGRILISLVGVGRRIVHNRIASVLLPILTVSATPFVSCCYATSSVNWLL